METTLGSVELGDQRSMHIATLSHETVIENDAAHLGFDGYFLFEVSENPERKGITILGKTCSVDAALRLIEVWQSRGQTTTV